MVTTQQATAKEAAHRMLDYPPRLSFVQKSVHLGISDRLALHDEMPRFKRGIAGIGIAGEVLRRVYIHTDLTPEVDIPDKIGGLRTEVVFSTGFSTRASARRSALSPVPCGVSTGHYQISAGTLGCLIDTSSGRCILSNNHVLANANTADIGDAIMQPGPSDATAESQPRRIARLSDYEPLLFGSAPNHIDAAIAALDDHASAIPDIMTIGRPVNPPVPAFRNQGVAKHGRTTGLTYGTVVDVSFDGPIAVDNRTAYFEDQIVIVGNAVPFSDAGDSGSLILDSPGSHPVGLLFAGDDTHTLANPIQAALDRFGATIVTA